MDGRRFRIEAWMPSPKIPSPPTHLERSVEEGVFFWLLFFAPAKKSDSPVGESFSPERRMVLLSDAQSYCLGSPAIRAWG